MESIIPDIMVFNVFNFSVYNHNRSAVGSLMKVPNFENHLSIDADLTHILKTVKQLSLFAECTEKPYLSTRRSEVTSNK